MKLYIANCTKQVQVFSYRIIEKNGVRTQTIPMGGQIALADDLTSNEVDDIIEQHAKYGLIDAAMVDRTKEFIGLCYSIDKIVPMTRLRSSLEHNDGVLVERGKQLQTEAALAVNQQIEHSLEESHVPGGLKDLTVSWAEERRDGAEPTINSGVHVSRDNPPDHRGGRRGGRNQRVA